ncbi:3-oxoacyl-[acyl-carrier protein] reductase [Fulvivirga imtechensis AK7]|uniref:3-oxoacyl-[acyl-carrier protein] reductase n=1 Tax=Fulvivirga imtechensis AK7 TaxID=1237149 RepID=L8JIH5_9BACT|nr:SDR family oxidoreductase [Fulvivirga imtechensis]ELR68630.1 3-oxoacyl-[acyl-carrier protein] reductase [Fulvivirga imtechensis AK7]
MMRFSGINKFLLGSATVIGGAIAVRSMVRAVKKYNLRDKVVLITGGSRGLGLVMARQLVDLGAKVVVCARDEEELVRSAEELSVRTQHYLAVPCDITDPKQVQQLIEETESIMGPVDVLINNAGIIQVGPMETLSDQDYEQAMKVHFWGPYYLMKAVIPGMKQRKNGRIVNIVSIGDKVSFPHLLPYNASKYALSGLSEGLTAELRRSGIKVTTIYPGLMRTGSPRNIDVKGRHEEEYAWFKISDSLPVISMNAERASKQIINAMRHGERTRTLSFTAKLAKAVHGIAPDLTISAFEAINSLLPGPEGGSKEKRKGYESDSAISSSSLTEKTKKAEVRNNEL